MSLFKREIRDFKESIPQDPNDPLVEHIYASYPFGKEGFGLRFMIRLIIFTVYEMKQRGMLK